MEVTHDMFKRPTFEQEFEANKDALIRARIHTKHEERVEI